MDLTLELSFDMTKNGQISVIQNELSYLCEKNNCIQKYFTYEIEGESTYVNRSECILTVNFDRLYVAEEQSWFDRSLREELGLLPNSTEYIDIDALSPETFDIRMFSPDELLNSGSSLVYYYGYDIHGSKLTNNPTLKDFFEKQDENGNYLFSESIPKCS